MPDPTYQNPTFGTVTTKTNIEDNSAEKVLVQNSLGKLNWIYKNSLMPENYTNIVYVNANNPNSATIFDLNNPPVTNDNLLKSDVNNLYIGTDASTWVYKTSTAIYETKIVTSSTSNFYLSGTSTDAGNSKTANIKRTGRVGGGNAVDPDDFITKAQHDLKENSSNKTGTVTGNEASTSLYLHIAGMIAYFQQKLTDSIFGTFITSFTAKVTIVDGDTSVVSDSADSGKAKKVTWANIFSYIKSKSETEISYACSDEVSDLAVGTLITFRMPFGMTLTALKLSLNTAPTGTKLIVDVRKGGVTILSTLISVDISATTSVGASVPYVISDSNLTDDSIITILTTQVGSTVAGKGLKVTFLGRRI